MTIRQPMLAVAADDLNALRYPLLASTKMDGCRAIITPDGPRTRSMKPIPNKFMQKLLSKLPPGLDGEIGVLDAYGAVDFRATTKAFMSHEGSPDFIFHVFDNYLVPGGFHFRWCSVVGWHGLPGWVEIVSQINVNNSGQVRELFAKALADGHEGLILRDRDAPYKFGRSTLNEHGMLKVKPWTDDEAVIVDVVQECENTNEIVLDERGYAKRSSAKGGKVPKKSMGTLVVRSPKWPGTFEIGTGFSADDRESMWLDRFDLIGKVAKFKYVMVGGYDVPRSCVFLGIRAPEDM